MKTNKCRLNWWAMLASLLAGIILGAVGVLLGKRYLAPRKTEHDDRVGFDYCDYDFDDYYDDDLQYRDNEDSQLDDESGTYSF